MPVRKMLWILGALVMFALALGAQEQSSKVIKHVPVKPMSPASGKEMYNNYCAVCHGLDGKGAGPAAEALKVPPTDLSTLSKKNGGKFPALAVAATIRGESAVPAHGSKEMPVWGKLFWSMSGGHEGEVQQRLANLTNYLDGMQQK